MIQIVDPKFQRKTPFGVLDHVSVEQIITDRRQNRTGSPMKRSFYEYGVGVGGQFETSGNGVDVYIQGADWQAFSQARAGLQGKYPSGADHDEAAMYELEAYLVSTGVFGEGAVVVDEG